MTDHYLYFIKTRKPIVYFITYLQFYSAFSWAAQAIFQPFRGRLKQFFSLFAGGVYNLSAAFVHMHLIHYVPLNKIGGQLIYSV